MSVLPFVSYVSLLSTPKGLFSGLFAEAMAMGSSWCSVFCVAGLQCLMPTLVVAWRPGLWDFDPDYNTTLPEPSLIPPISRTATRDQAILKWQILGIVGGYVLTVIFLFTLLFTVGRRLRRSAQSSHGTLSMEMVKPNKWMQDPSPKVKSTSAFHKWGKKTPTASPASTSQATFDPNAVTTHKEQQEQDMERLYAAVFANDTKAPKEVSIKEQEITTPSQGHTRNLSASSKRSFSQRKPPQLADQEPSHYPPVSPVSPASTYQQPPYSASMHSIHSRQDSDTSSRRETTMATNGTSQTRSSKSKAARSLRNLTISAPMPTNKYPGVEKDEEASTPLSPRYPENMRQPSPPLRARPITPIQDEFDPDDGDVARPYGYEELDQPRPLPTAAPQRGMPGSTGQSLPPPLPPPPKDISSISASSSSNQLPFRQHTQVPSGSTLSGSTVMPNSPGATKTTLLSPRKDRFAPGQAHPHGFVGVGGPQSAGLASAGLATPYSPYMPFSPVTPVTPRLTTRTERKQRQRDEGRRVANADEDLVRDEKEMWGDGW